MGLEQTDSSLSFCGILEQLVYSWEQNIFHNTETFCLRLRLKRHRWIPHSWFTQAFSTVGSHHQDLQPCRQVEGVSVFPYAVWDDDGIKSVQTSISQTPLTFVSPCTAASVLLRIIYYFIPEIMVAVNRQKASEQILWNVQYKLVMANELGIVTDVAILSYSNIKKKEHKNRRSWTNPKGWREIFKKRWGRGSPQWSQW